MLDRIMGFVDLKKVNKLLTNTEIQLRTDSGRIHIIWLGYHIAKEHSGNVVFRAGIHKHSFHELHLCINGNCVYQVGDMQYTLHAGDIILLRKEETHRLVKKSSDFCKIALGYAIQAASGDLTDELEKLLSQMPVMVSDHTEEILSLFYRILQECSTQKIGYLSVIEGILLNIIVLCARLNEGAATTAPTFGKQIDQRIADVNAYIEMHLSETFSCQDIAENVHLSLRQLNRIIQNEFGVSISDYVDRVRCAYAKNLLLHTDLSNSDIAEKVGYASEFSFSKFFKRVEGMAPSQFRRSRFGGYIKVVMEDD